MALTQVTTHGIKDATVATADISNDSITSAKIIANSITSSELANGAVTNAKLNNNSITTAKINDSQITSAKIADNTIVNADINTSAAILGTKISPNFGSQLIQTTGSVVAGGMQSTANLSLDSDVPTINFNDTNSENDFSLANNNGTFTLRDKDAGVDRFKIASDGTTDITNNLNVGGNLSLPDDKYIYLGNGNDLSIRVDEASGTDHSYIFHTGNGIFKLASNTYFQIGKTGPETYIECNSDGNVELYYDNSKKFETTLTGISVTGGLTASGASTFNEDVNFTGANYNALWDKSANSLKFDDNTEAKFGTHGDLRIFHANGYNYIRTGYSDSEIHIKDESGSNIAKFKASGNNELYYDASKKLETTSTGVSINGIFHMPDNNTIKLGTGNDLQIYHDGSNSYINNFTGNLILRPKSGEAGVLMVPNGSTELYYDGVKKLETLTGGVNIVGSLTVNGSAISSGGLSNIVEDTTPQLGGDLDVNGHQIKVPDLSGADNVIYIGTGDDLQLYHASGGNSYVDDYGSGELLIRGSVVSINKQGSAEVMAKFTQDGAAELYYDNSKKFETYSGGVRVHGELLMQNNSLYLNDNAKLRLGTGQDLNIYHDGSHSRLVNNQGLLLLQSTGVRLLNAGGTENMLIAIPDAQVELYYDNSKKFQTASSGCYFLGDDTHWSQGHMNPYNNNDYNLGSASYRWANAFISQAIDFQDSAKAQFGNSDDLQIYHNGTNSYIDNTNGVFYIRQGSGGNNIQIQALVSEDSIKAIPNGAVELYYDNSKKLETTTNGAKVTGNYIELDKGSSAGTAFIIDTTATSGATRFRFRENGSTKGQIVYSHDNNQIELAGDSGQSAAILVNFSEYALRAIANGATEVYYNGSKKFQTTSSGTELFNRAQLTQSSNDFVQKLDASNSGYSTNIIKIHATRGAASNWAFLAADSNHGGGADREFTLRGDGHAYADNSWNANGADYAEYFESSTGSAIAVGTTVVLENNKVRAATSSDAVADIIGVVRPKEASQASTTIGNAAWNKWQGKYLTDDFDRYILDEHNVIEWTDADGKEHSYGSHAIPSDVNVPSEPTIKTQDENGNKFTHYRLNPNYNSERTYLPRHDRDEWVIVGLVGQVKVLKGQAANDRWIKMRDVSDTVQEYFIR